MPIVSFFVGIYSCNGSMKKDSSNVLLMIVYKYPQLPVRETHTYPCLQDRTDGRSPVRETNTYPCLQDRTVGLSPVRETHTYPCLQDRTDGRSPVRETRTYPCLQDRTDGRSPVRETRTYIPAYKTAQMAGRLGFLSDLHYRQLHPSLLKKRKHHQIPSPIHTNHHCSLDQS